MVDSLEVSAGRTTMLNVAMWVTFLGVVCAVVAGVLTAVGGSTAVIRPVAFLTMVCAIVAGAGAVMHTSNGIKALYAMAAVGILIAGSTFFGLTFSSS